MCERIKWKPDYAGPPHLFSLHHRANAVAEYLGTESPYTYFSVIRLLEQRGTGTERSKNLREQSGEREVAER